MIIKKLNDKKAELSNVTIAIIIILVLVFLGFALLFSKFSEFRSTLGM